MQIGDIIKCRRGSNEIIFRIRDMDDVALFKSRCDSVELVEKGPCTHEHFNPTCPECGDKNGWGG